MNIVIFSLGAGGSHPSNIEVVDRINIVGGVCIVIASIFGGSINNQLGPKYTIIFGISGYPLYVGSMW